MCKLKVCYKYNCLHNLFFYSHFFANPLLCFSFFISYSLLQGFPNQPNHSKFHRHCHIGLSWQGGCWKSQFIRILQDGRLIDKHLCASKNMELIKLLQGVLGI